MTGNSIWDLLNADLPPGYIPERMTGNAQPMPEEEIDYGSKSVLGESDALTVNRSAGGGLPEVEVDYASRSAFRRKR